MATVLDALDQINVTTRRYIREDPALVDAIFNNDPLNWLMRGVLKEGFNGGSSINENFEYDTLIGGGYLKGKQFNTTQKQIEKQCRFDVKFQQVSVPFFQEDVSVLNRGPQAVISLLKTRVNAAYRMMGAMTSIAAYMETNGTAGMFPSITGLAEALSDGSTQSWNGVTYATYGGLTRSSYNNALTSVPVNLNNVSLEYNVLDKLYMSVMYGSGMYEPNYCITTPNGLSIIKSKFQTQQRFQEVTVPTVGFTGLKFNNATVLAGRYCPGAMINGKDPSVNSVQDVAAVNFLNEMSDGAITTYPLGNLYQSSIASETLFILNARKPFLNYYVSDDPLFGGGFRPFIPQAGNTVLVGQVLLAHQMTVLPKYHRQLYGFIS